MAGGGISARLQGELLQCWLARAVTQVAERAVITRGVSLVAFAVVGPRDRLILSTTNSIAQFVAAFASSSAALRVDSDAILRIDEAEHVARPPASDSVDKKLLVAITRAGDSHPSDSALHASGCELLLTVTLADATTPDAASWPWKCALSSLTRSPDEEDELLFLCRPLEQLNNQCGWRLALEVLSWVSSDSTTSNPTINDSQLATKPLFTKPSQLPFQLVLLLLRWSFFHPAVVHILDRRLRRQLELTPAPRTRRDVSSAQQLGQQLWSHLYPDNPLLSLSSPVNSGTSPATTAFKASTTEQQTLSTLPDLGRLSKCQLWDAQKQFYLDRGIQAWSNGVVPFGVSSSAFIAATYAKVAVDFLLSQDTVPSTQRGSQEPNCFVWEAASGSCKFLHHFVLFFYAQVELRATAFQSKGLVPLIVASDLSEQVLSSRMRMPYFQPWLQQGKLEFARFDTSAFVSGPSAQQLKLKHSNKVWRPGSDGSLFLIGNYFFDSLRTDVFALTTASSATTTESPRTSCLVYEAAIDPTTSSIAEMDLVFRPPVQVVDGDSIVFFNDNVSNIVFKRIVDEFIKEDSGAPRSGLVLFPTEAIAFLSSLANNSISKSSSRHAIGIVAGDAGFSFRDAISSAFLADKHPKAQLEGVISLELPQLSPHPDCFCLPVDFQVFQFVIEALGMTTSSGGVSTTTQTASTLASDTFDVFYATIDPTSTAKASDQVTNLSSLSFSQELTAFTPGDCDLLWGMMSVDDGARHLSTATLLALMAHTSCDFDLFAAVQWPLLHRWLALRGEPMRDQLIAAGAQAWRTYYEVESSDEGDKKPHSRLVLQVARWFYVLQAYQVVLQVLEPWTSTDRQDESNVSAVHLLGLTSARLHDHWKALALFRTCSRLQPTRIKFQTQVASTLLRLQHLRHGPPS